MWENSKFADWVRGSEKPNMLTMSDWVKWEEETKAKSKIRFWLAEEGLYILENIFRKPTNLIHSVRYYVVNRWWLRTNSLTASRKDIKPGRWADLGYRFVPCLFNELQNFVEIESARMFLLFSEKEERDKYNAPFWAFGLFRIPWRSPDAGLAHLRWQIDSNDVPGHQSYAAKEILELYTWWTFIYRNRIDPWETKDLSMDDITGILEAYSKEDEEMLIRLIKIRDSLWT